MKKQIAVLLSISLIVIALPISVLLYLIKSDETMNDKKISRALFGIDLDHYTIIQKDNLLSKDEIEQIYYYQGGSKRDWIKSKVTRWGFSTGYVFIVNLENEDYRVGLCYLD